MVDTFYSGGFAFVGPVVEWDGVNHLEIVDWINAVATATWYVDSVNSSTLALYSGVGSPRLYQLGAWIGRNSYGPTAAPKDGRWQTSDPYGRPESVTDVEAP